MRRRKLVYFISCIMLCCASPCAAQRMDDDSISHFDDTDFEEQTAGAETPVPERTIIYNTAKPDAAQWKQATGGEAFGYRDKREYVRKPEPPPENPGWYQFLVRFAEFLTSSAGKALLWSALALIVGFIIYRVLTGQGSLLFGRRDRKVAGPESDPGHVSEEGLLENDWEERLRAALAAGDQRLAIRYSYMHLLQAMQERGLIVYRPDKTNAAYHRELTESLRQSFRTISRQYEYAWYGNFLPDPAAMESYMQTYGGLKKSITYA